MKIRITRGGIFGKDGEIAVGTELDVKEEPKGWAGRYEVISGGGGKNKEAVSGDGGGEPKTAAEVLKMATDGSQFMAFKAAATKLLGDKTPANKADIVAALEDLATQP
ncbi:hypothetical protein GOC90_25440 [Sinorhizobium medicae]|uniref:hypothetical protein n=1 Tax=Sinorhizobium medicae TaxID=110321 RepID=UPI000FD76A31|nr:hypothetical protein [Sinorhizobium medicae]MDX0610770.1 hypothetical protein [Sinorhizobium medicae]MDX0647805.1 hypothetical protein [Sinorhizobium medicae]MDX0760386.1 hypothetical protein [Sinorhizobium medicae]MDX0797104.1 hypothetical protein [Sinorhizobium medicae]MDX1109246.1 hypothetical protein [Sinorhizobium medicae]